MREEDFRLASTDEHALTNYGSPSVTISVNPGSRNCSRRKQEKRIASMRFGAPAVPTTTSGVSQTGTRRFGITDDGVMHGDATSLTAYSDRTAVINATALGN